MSEQTTITFVVWGPIACDVGNVAADAVGVDALARLRLVGLRRGCAVRLQGWSDELRDLVSFVGLQRILLS